MNPYIFREAIASVAMEHASGHGCRVCRAAGGDMQALIDLWVECYFDVQREESRP